jgi:hypothetical protein
MSSSAKIREQIEALQAARRLQEAEEKRLVQLAAETERAEEEKRRRDAEEAAERRRIAEEAERRAKIEKDREMDRVRLEQLQEELERLTAARKMAAMAEKNGDLVAGWPAVPTKDFGVGPSQRSATRASEAPEQWRCWNCVQRKKECIKTE